MKGLILGLIGLLIVTNASGDHDILEGAGKTDLTIIHLYKADMELSEKNVGPAKIMSGAIKYANDMTTCVAYWSVAAALLDEVAEQGLINPQLVNHAVYASYVTSSQLTLYVVALEQHKGSNAFNASSFVHTAMIIGKEKVETILTQIVTDGVKDWNKHYSGICLPIYENHLQLIGQVESAIEQGYDIEQLVPQSDQPDINNLKKDEYVL
jgi:hypothetical protein